MYNDHNYLLELYMGLKRVQLHNPYIRMQKSETQRRNFEKFTALMDTLKADPTDFLHFAIKYYAPMRVFPSPSHLIAEKMVNKYRYRQNLRNIYVCELFNMERDKVFIYETTEEVEYKDFSRAPDADPRLRYAVWLSAQSKFRSPDSDFRDVIYAITKLSFLNKPIPRELLELKEKLYASKSV